MKKLALILFGLAINFQAVAMQSHRVAMAKMHARSGHQTQAPYNVDDQLDRLGEPRETHRPSFIGGYSRSCSWRKQLIGAALCTMLLCAEAAPIFNQVRPHRSTSHAIRGHVVEAVEEIANTTRAGRADDFDDDGTCCLAAAADYQQLCSVKHAHQQIKKEGARELSAQEREDREIAELMHDAEIGYKAGVKARVKSLFGDDTLWHLVNAKDHSGRTVLMHAAMYGQEGIIKFLLEHGADASMRDFGHATAADIARAAGYKKLANLIPSYAKRVECLHVDVSDSALIEHMTRLQFAELFSEHSSEDVRRAVIQHGEEEALANFVKSIHCGAKIDEGSYAGSPEKPTPLMVAGGSGYAKFFELLLKAGAKMGSVDRSGRSVLDYIIGGARLAESDSEPFGLSVLKDHRTCMRLLMQHSHLDKAAVKRHIIQQIDADEQGQPAEYKKELFDRVSHSLLDE